MLQTSRLPWADIRGADREYVAFHAPRFTYLLDLPSRAGVGTGTRVLDIGPGALTKLIRRQFQIPVDTLGFGSDTSTAEGRHFELDLNCCQHPERCRRDIPQYDVIVMAEVIEHLHTAPELVLAFLRSLVAPAGILIVQTPNAAALPKRIKLLIGRNPYETIRVDDTNPGHFREYTLEEMRHLATAAGFSVEAQFTGFYFDERFAPRGTVHGEPQWIVGSLKNVAYRMLPRSMRGGQTLVLRRPA